MRVRLLLVTAALALACEPTAKPTTASPLSQFDGVIDRVGNHLSGNVIAWFSPGNPRLPVTGSVSGRDVRLWFGSEFVFSGIMDDAPDATTGTIGVTGVLIGADVGPIPERLTLR